MHPQSRTRIQEILSPACGAEGAESQSPEAFSLAQILQPAGPCGGEELDIPYTGPERRAQGVLVAEVIKGLEIRPG